MNKKILITGGLGFIGSHLIEALRDNYDITVIDNASNAKVMSWDINKNDGRNKVKIIIHNVTLCVDDSIYYDYVIHLAAIATISDTFNPLLYSVNVHGFENIYRRVKCGNFIYASSAAAINKANDYGKTKAHNEAIVGNNGLGLRFFNVYGPRDNGVVGKLLKPNPYVYGGTQTRDFVYIDDVVKTIVDNLDSKGIIEVGTGVSTSILELAEYLNIKAIFSPYISFEEMHSCCTNPIKNPIPLYKGLSLMLNK